ncbi:two-component sensor histidine kinase [Nocardia neocaledoniensis NBRC 108232]|uniref:histidine kinase n=1 Tax=Nocardia neocaledoniensis TaxID=236511 RepID=A0A317NUR7_9NOCA|nr:HAMP domain-containing sensor histidine kinase [Nocardia neocaledoniensis]PWV78054.1 two-component system OmpR family sensor kinase [Nocardia neocaledoniensis]GEM29824.1 two-component sensor histidine kinase [Nocardia neocaledoniensis NBRC 108232]
MRTGLRERLSAVPLRVTLVLVLVLMAGFGLVASGFVVTKAMENSLLNRTDQQLTDAAVEWERRVGLPAPPLPAPDRQPPSRYYLHAESSDGTRNVTLDNVFGTGAKPALPDPPALQPVTVGSAGDSTEQWRVLTVVGKHASATVALPLTENLETVRNLVVLQLVVGAIVLTALAIGAYFVVRGSLRPLRRVEATAAAIAGGELHHRIPVRGNDTEVDRLSRSLNSMLTQIQQAFAATEASESAARESEARMRRFVADASHELRTPLTTIRGFAELYRQGATDDPALFMNRIEHEAQRMGLLVEDLLMLARLDAQRPVDLRPVDLLALAGDAVHSARAVEAAAGEHRPITLEIAEGTGTLEILGDEHRLRQILTNLLNNARTHTPDGTTITVRLTPAADEVRLEVADTGPGLSPEESARIFERFYRADTSRARSSGGTGLGLSIVAALVAAHQGTVEVTRTPGGGATFVVRLPRNDRGPA